MSRRRPLALPEAVRYFHGAQRATDAVCVRLRESGADVSVAEEMQQLASGYRAALEETMVIPLAGDLEVEQASDPLPVLATWLRESAALGIPGCSEIAVTLPLASSGLSLLVLEVEDVEVDAVVLTCPSTVRLELATDCAGSAVLNCAQLNRRARLIGGMELHENKLRLVPTQVELWPAPVDLAGPAWRHFMRSEGGWELVGPG